MPNTIDPRDGLPGNPGNPEEPSPPVANAGAAPIEAIRRAQAHAMEMTSPKASPKPRAVRPAKVKQDTPLNPLRAGHAHAVAMQHAALAKVGDLAALPDHDAGPAPQLARSGTAASRGRSAQARPARRKRPARGRKGKR